jgi:hypothetical protein
MSQYTAGVKNSYVLHTSLYKDGVEMELESEWRTGHHLKIEAVATLLNVETVERDKRIAQLEASLAQVKKFALDTLMGVYVSSYPKPLFERIANYSEQGGLSLGVISDMAEKYIDEIAAPKAESANLMPKVGDKVRIRDRADDELGMKLFYSNVPYDTVVFINERGLYQLEYGADGSLSHTLWEADQLEAYEAIKSTLAEPEINWLARAYSRAAGDFQVPVFSQEQKTVPNCVVSTGEDAAGKLHFQLVPEKNTNENYEAIFNRRRELGLGK